MYVPQQFICLLLVPADLERDPLEELEDVAVVEVLDGVVAGGEGAGVVAGVDQGLDQDQMVPEIIDFVSTSGFKIEIQNHLSFFLSFGILINSSMTLMIFSLLFLASAVVSAP